MQCFYNLQIVNKCSECSHLLSFGIKREFYNKDAMLTIKFDPIEIYKYDTKDYLLDSMDKFIPIDSQNPSLNKSNKASSECFQYMISQYEKVKGIIHDPSMLVENDKAKTVIKK